ncbi:cation:proton antiporter [Sulfolobus sp. S-194]|uniref:cation:proton antiporter n=1 Tax=Sulfolobus sp. S-194 TaxID=2512240 RepID=UPI001436DB0E|nr:cation:proton antiporter [Sulfolobus sp. S-194]QIW24827.1 cation:proton antiporter [Sulfolobus sp. S-194]
MSEFTSLAEVLVIASFLGLLLRRINVSPVIAYLFSGIIGVELGLNYSSSIFQFLTFLAINLLSFEMGVSVNLVDLKKIFRRALFIVLTEFLVVTTIVMLISLFIRLNFISTILLIVIGFNTSTSIAYKLAEKTLDQNDLKIVLSVSSLEDTVAFVVLGVISSNSFNLIEIIVSAFISITLGYLISKLLINPTINFSEDSIILSGVASVFLFNILSQLLNIPSTLASFLLGIGTSYASSNNEKIVKSIKPLTDFTLILFFFVAGSYIKLSTYLLYALPISIVLVLTKYIAFSTAYWMSGIEFIRAFRTGLFMSSLSEFGIIISLTALQEGLPVLSAYNISSIVVAVSSTIASIVTTRNKAIISILNKIYYKLSLNKVDNVIRRASSHHLKIPEIVIVMVRYIIISGTITFSGAYIIYLLYTISPFLIYVSYILIVVIPAMLFTLLITTTNNIRGRYGEADFIVELFFVIVFIINVFEFEIFFLKLISFNIIVFILSIAIGSIITILSFSRIKKLLEDIEKLF